MRERIYYDEKEQRVIVTARALASFAANGRGIPFENTDTSGCITDSGVCVAADLDRTLDGPPSAFFCEKQRQLRQPVELFEMSHGNGEHILCLTFQAAHVAWME